MVSHILAEPGKYVDYSRPDLGDQLLDRITRSSQAVYGSPNPDVHNHLVLRRSLTMLNQVMKELAAGKVPSLTSAFQVVREHTLDHDLSPLTRKSSACKASAGYTAGAVQKRVCGVRRQSIIVQPDYRR